MSLIKVGLIGFGYWGPNVARNLEKSKKFDLTTICDMSEQRLSIAELDYPRAKLLTDSYDLFKDNNIDLIAIATPVSTHYDLAKKALISGKHIFVEKPFTYNSDHAKELIDIADSKNLTIMVDHTFLFTSAVRKIKELIVEGTLGNLYYFDSIRVNLGLFQHDVNVIWDLAPHDISIMNYLIEDLSPISVNAVGLEHLRENLEDVAHVHVKFQNNFMASFNMNWLSPVKIRQTMLAGDKKMLLWNDLSSDGKIKVYDVGVEIKNIEGVYDTLVQYRTGEMWSPYLEDREALEVEIEYLASCIASGEKPINSGIEGLRVVKLLEAAEESARNFGREIKLSG